MPYTKEDLQNVCVLLSGLLPTVNMFQPDSTAHNVVKYALKVYEEAKAEMGFPPSV